MTRKHPVFRTLAEIPRFKPATVTQTTPVGARRRDRVNAR